MGSSSVGDACYVYPEGAEELVPAVELSQATCNFLSGVSVNGSALVGPVDDGSCGGGSVSSYLTNGETYANSVIFYAAIAFAVVTGIQFLLFIASFSVLCCGNYQRD